MSVGLDFKARKPEYPPALKKHEVALTENLILLFILNLYFEEIPFAAFGLLSEVSLSLISTKCIRIRPLIIYMLSNFSGKSDGHFNYK